MLPHVSVEVVYRDRRLKEVRTTESSSHFIERALFVKQASYSSPVSFIFLNDKLTNNLGYLATSYAVLCADCISGVIILFTLANIFIM